MAITTYATTAEVKAALDVAGATEDTKIFAALVAASRAIDRHCGRRFWIDDDADQTRIFTPDNHVLLAVDDIAALTSVETRDSIGGAWTAWTSDDWLLDPVNAQAATDDQRPYTRILAVDDKRWPITDHSTRVTAQFGWPAVPDSVQQACVLQAVAIYQRVDQGAESPAPTFDQPVMRRGSRYLDPTVQLLLGPFIRFDALAV